MNIKVIGLILIGLGILGLAVPAFTTHEDKEVLRVGDVRLNANVEETHTVPPLLAGAVLLVGGVLFGVGVRKRT
jgi:hypothetical protein